MSPSPQPTGTGNSRSPGKTVSIATTYYGIITFANNYSSNLELCSVAQSGNQISGNLKVKNGPGSGSFSGSIDTASRVSFVVSNPAGEYGSMEFFASIGPTGSMNGTYVVNNPRQQGSWNAGLTPSSSPSLC